jgi:hypothetical protein
MVIGARGDKAGVPVHTTSTAYTVIFRASMCQMPTFEIAIHFFGLEIAEYGT